MKVSRKAAHKLNNIQTASMGAVCMAEAALMRQIPDIQEALKYLALAKDCIRKETDYINAHTVEEIKTEDEETP